MSTAVINPTDTKGKKDFLRTLPAWADRFCMALVLILCLWSGSSVQAKEVDQYTQRRLVLEQLRDDSWQLDDHINGVIARTVQCLNHTALQFRGSVERLQLKCFRENFLDPVVPQLRSPIEEWVSNASRMHNFRLHDHGIFGGDVDYDDMFMGWYVEMSPIIRVNTVFFGVDKAGHFFSQGLEYYQHWLEKREAGLSLSDADESVREYGYRSELGTLGLEGTGVFSFGDLAANWQGFQFYKSFLGRYVRQVHGTFVQCRRWQFSTFVVEDFDEVLNPVRLQNQRFYQKVKVNFWRSESGRPSICQEYIANPALFTAGQGARAARLNPGEYIWKWNELSAEHSRWRLRLNELCH